ncbi:DNA polymerase III subunit beta [Candidatus Roizmanbacteria bacterium RIFCSPLOWO2_02_FULL_36_11]|uniref:Beta sliding clamp n=1 Tax=Candidatus Roizmanbacteria bacterium RIFCSPLOWO2_02_FULL_36_11 TaxID=1802071 RepID=A0A1F7JH25_9BACT|nr:MAG: DNA polymerase III subunit beta [Candidatus Roizmanbacteria bacterium RIFCSPLOWO2_02_FULL_36_11]
MKLSILKDFLQEKIFNAQKFTLSKTSSVPLLQNGLIQVFDKKIAITTTNLNDFFYTELKNDTNEEKNNVVDIKKIGEYLSLLPSGKIDLEFSDTSLIISMGKTKATFPVIKADDFPKIPTIEGKKHILEKKLINDYLSLVIFAAATDESRPILTGIYFQTSDDNLNIVATDGFRLSLVTKKTKETLPKTIISAKTINDITKLLNEDQDLEMTISETEKMVKFDLKKMEISSRLIDGDFPPFQKVIPTQHRTKFIVERDELLRNIKLSSVFARELSNTIVLDIKKDGLYIKPKSSPGDDSIMYQPIEMEGEEKIIAFNFKFVLEFLSISKAKKIQFEMVDKNAPGLFREVGNDNFIHVIMPVRIEETNV